PHRELETRCIRLGPHRPGQVVEVQTEARRGLRLHLHLSSNDERNASGQVNGVRMAAGRGLRRIHARHLGSAPTLTVMLCSMVAAIRAALFLSCSALVPLKRTATAV